jgi:hypothetical protein
MARMQSFKRDSRGNVLVTFGLLTPVLMLVAGVAVDYSDASRARSILQSTADSAALAGARELGLTGAEEQAKTVAAQFVASKSPEATRSIAASGVQVSVDLSVAKSTYFGGILGLSTLPVGVRATAVYDAGPLPCMLALGPDEPTGIGLIGSAKINAPKCVVHSNAKASNSIATQGAASITASKVCSVGESSPRSTPAAVPCSAVTDPFKDRNFQTANPGAPKAAKVAGLTTPYMGTCDFTNMQVGAKGVVTLTPGVYCGGLAIKSTDVILSPGVYVIQDGPLSIESNSAVSGAAVSILLSGNGAVLDLQGSPSLTLSAMSTGPMAGMAIVADTPASPVLTSEWRGSPDIKVTGTVYLPNQRLKMQGSPSLDMLGLSDALVALSFDLHGSPDIRIKSDSAVMPPGAAQGVRLIK